MHHKVLLTQPYTVQAKLQISFGHNMHTTCGQEGRGKIPFKKKETSQKGSFIPTRQSAAQWDNCWSG